MTAIGIRLLKVTLVVAPLLLGATALALALGAATTRLW